jgi:hypothetical protein
MSYIPLGEQRNRYWDWRDTGYEHPVSYFAPCAGVTDDGYQITHDCFASGATTTTTTTNDDSCGRPFRTGSTYTQLTATSSADMKCGRPFRT